MKITKLELRSDKNKDSYLYCTYVDRKGKERHMCLNHYDLEYALKGKISYETKNIKK